MMAAPGTLNNKVASAGIRGYVSNCLQAVDMYADYLGWLVVAFLVLVVCAVLNGYEKNLGVSLIFFSRV